VFRPLQKVTLNLTLRKCHNYLRSLSIGIGISCALQPLAGAITLKDPRSTPTRTDAVVATASNTRAADERNLSHASAVHNVSTVTTTVRFPVRVDTRLDGTSTEVHDQQRTDSIVRKLLGSAPGSDSPDGTPGVESERAAASNLNLYEVIAASFIRSHQFDKERLKDLDTTEVVMGPQSHQNVFHLTHGNVLFAPKRDIEVLTDLGNIHIAAGSVVCVMKPTDGTVSIYDLDDSGKKRVAIQLANELLTLVPGKQLIITNQQAKQFSEVNPSPHIHFRKAVQTTTQSGLKVHTVEFSIPAAILTLKPLRKMLLSGDPADRKLTNRLIKTVVILEDLFTDSEPYRMCETPLVNKISSNTH
jgi:hypothetical protein